MMQKFLGALLITLAFVSSARADVSCAPQASGVSGVIANQTDVISAVNCLGQQLARLRSDATISDRNELARLDDMARQIAALQNAVANLARRVSAIEANITNVEQPLARQPW